ncbi:hypothetical protein SCUCBS95973_005067 [Sporothrix curviconia]|uniref:Protein SSH4 n=1 Tax=Sporothrix curviconia TaxID=1260050 RepID=A0ABP0BUD5_9PEZI
MSNHPYYQDDPASNLPTGLPGYSLRRPSYASAAMQPSNTGGYGRSSTTFQHLLNASSGDGSDSNGIHNGLGNGSLGSLRPPYGSSNNNSSSSLNLAAGAETDSLWTGGNSTSDSALLRLLGSRNAQLPSFSRAFEPFLRRPAFDGSGPIAPGSNSNNSSAAATTTTTTTTTTNTGFFTPSYLRDSVYVQRLEDQYKAKIQANRENLQQQELHARQAPAHAHGNAVLAASDPAAAAAAATQASTRGMRGGSLYEEAYGGLDTYASLTNISIANAPTIPGDGKMSLSKLDVGFDLDDRGSGRHSGARRRAGTGSGWAGAAAGLGADEESFAPLPSRWATDDKAASLDVLSDGLSVKLSSSRSANDHGQHNSSSSSSSSSAQEASSVRADHFMPPQCGIYYFEATILSKKREEPMIGIGFCEASAKLTRPPGWEHGSWAYHSDDGNAFTETATGKSYGPPFGPGDVVGCGVNFRTGTAFFTRNGEDLGIAFRDIKGPNLKLFPVVGMRKSGEQLRVNFGQLPFTFDIDGLMKKEKLIIRQQILETSTDELSPAKSETDLVQQLVLQFLQHDGYVDTARAFAKEIQAEKSALAVDSDEPVQGYNVADDLDANKRQSIRQAVLEGNIDRAIALTEAGYPHVLEKNKAVQFRLKCRKFIEMIRKEAELNLVHGGNNGNGSIANADAGGDGAARANGHSQQGMDVDDIVMAGDGTDGQPRPEGRALVNQALRYGQALQVEFQSELRPRIQTVLNEIFSLLAYANPLKQPEVAHLLDQRGRVAVAEDLNAAILEATGKSSRSALENLYTQTSVLLEDLRRDGGPGAFVTIKDFVDDIPQPDTP